MERERNRLTESSGKERAISGKTIGTRPGLPRRPAPHETGFGVRSGCEGARGPPARMDGRGASQYVRRASCSVWASACVGGWRGREGSKGHTVVSPAPLPPALPPGRLPLSEASLRPLLCGAISPPEVDVILTVIIILIVSSRKASIFIFIIVISIVFIIIFILSNIIIIIITIIHCY